MNFTTAPADLLLSKESVYDKAELLLASLQKESESDEYKAHRFLINNKKICYREAKVTPTKTGQFVTLWKRNQTGIIEPFAYSDDIDFVIITVRKDQNWGQFIFPKKIALELSLIHI